MDTMNHEDVAVISVFEHEMSMTRLERINKRLLHIMFAESVILAAVAVYLGWRE